MHWVLGRITGNEFNVYLAIVRKTVGYNQYTSELLSYSAIAKLTGLSIRTVERIVPKLIEKKFIIKVATNQVAHVGKLPYRYQLNLKLPDFPSLGKLRKNREEKLPEPRKYIDITDKLKDLIRASISLALDGKPFSAALKTPNFKEKKKAAMTKLLPEFGLTQELIDEHEAIQAARIAGL